MAMNDFSEMVALITVARERSFTRAAVELGVTPSALSHKIRRFEERLGLRLLSRTTRSVAPTEIGEQLISAIGPYFEGIESELEALGAMRDRPAGKVRITCTDHVIDRLFLPKLPQFLAEYPEIELELNTDYGFTDIVSERFDAGVRIGESISKDMIAMRIGPDWRFAVVGSPAYLETHNHPDVPADLTRHSCINMRLPTQGSLYAWDFEKNGRQLSVRVDGRLTFNSLGPMLGAVLNGLGLGYMPEDLVRPHIENGSLQEVLRDWSPTLQGYHLYYPSRRNPSAAFTKFLETFRYRG